MNILTECFGCGSSFEKKRGEFNRTERRGAKHFCSLACSGKYSNSLRPTRDTSHMQARNGAARNDTDALSCFKETLKRAKARKHQEFNLTLEHLRDVWVEQEGQCPFLGVHLALPFGGHQLAVSRNRWASLDRIDSSKGYVVGNVRFISASLNLARNNGTDEDLLELFSLIRGCNGFRRGGGYGR